MNKRSLHGWRSFFILSLVFMWVLAAFTVKADDSEYCRELIGNGNSRAYVSIVTNPEGQIVLEIIPYDMSEETTAKYTAFRGDGFTAARVRLFRVNDDPNTDNKYFTGAAPGTGAAKTKFILTPVPGMLNAGDIISFGGQTMEWMTPLNTNAYGNALTKTYTYGRNCDNVQQPTPLATPSALSINPLTGILTFTGDINASSHTAFVYAGAIPLYEQANFNSGDELNFSTPGNYLIKVRSFGDNNMHLNSNYSDGIDWIIEGEIPPLGDSEFCHKYWDPTGTGANADNSDAVFLTWETLENGSMKVTIEGVAGNNPSFRAGSLNPGNLHLGAIATGTTFVDITQAANVATITPKSGVIIPDGLTIRYDGTVAYLTAGGATPNGNLYPTANFTYTYRTHCANVVKTKLDAPTNLSIDEEGNMTFDDVENASSYNAFVYLGETVVFSQISIGNGEKLNFFLPGVFKVRVVAVPDVTASEYIESDPSEAYTWTVSYKTPETVPVSSYCGWELDPSGGGNTVASDDDAAFWTWTTDNQGQIVISIVGKNTPETTAFRANGMSLNGFKIEGVSATMLLEKVGNNTGATQTFKAKEGITLLPGLSVTYSGQVEYRVLPLESEGALDDLYPTLTFPHPYIYGSNCSGEATVLDAPQNLSITDNKLSFDAVANATSYSVYVYTEDGVLVHSEKIFTSGSSIAYHIPGHYSVKVQAIGNAAEYLNSGLSEPLNWGLRDTLTKPVNVNIDTENKLSFDAVASAISYTVSVYQNEADATALVVLPDFVIGSVVEMGDNPYGTYYVKVQAIGDGDVILDSPVSEVYTWNFQAPYICNLLLTHPLVKGSSEITFINADGVETATAPFFATGAGWVPSSDYTFDVTDNVATIHLGPATTANWQAQFRVIPETPIYIKSGTPYKLKVKLKTSKSASVLAKIFDGNDNQFLELIARQTVNAPDGIVFETPSVIPPFGLTRIFQVLFDFAPSAADNTIEISDFVICGEEQTTSIENVRKADAISVYPVPAHDVLYINGISGSEKAQIIDIVGNIVDVRQTTGEINVSKLSKGIYFLMIDNQQIKFIKE